MSIFLDLKILNRYVKYVFHAWIRTYVCKRYQFLNISKLFIIITLVGKLSYIYTRCHKIFYRCVQIFNYKSDSNEDIPLAHFEQKIRPPEPLTDPRAAIVFQPMARVSPACTKTNQQPVDWLGALEV